MPLSMRWIKPYASRRVLRSADANLTVTDAQMLGAMVLRFTGALTAVRTITIPTRNKLIVIENATTGGFALAVKTPAGVAINFNVGDRKLLYCDGTTLQIVSEAAAASSIPYDIGGTLGGIPTGGSIILRYPLPRAVRFPVALAGSQGVAGTASGATAHFLSVKTAHNSPPCNLRRASAQPHSRQPPPLILRRVMC
jgi:hypothetical protein